MIKKLSVLALAGLIALPAVASAASNAELESQIEELSAQLSDIEEKSEGWDLASRIQVSGDIRNRLDSHKASTHDYWAADTVAGAMVAMLPGFGNDMDALLTYMNTLTAAQRQGALEGMGYAMTPGQDFEDSSLFTTRLRMNMRVKATENIEIKTRVVAYKAWGMQSNPTAGDESTPYFLNSMAFDGTMGRQPTGRAVLDRAFMNWNNIGGAPVWFSIGRRPTTDGPPAHIRLGSDKRLATPINFMDYPFDGISLGYAYSDLFGMTDGPGRFRFCYGRGFEEGPTVDGKGMADTDFAGIDWDVYKKGDRFINFQSFAAINIFNVPGDVTFTNVFEEAMGMGDGVLERENMGNIYHTSAVFMDKVQDLNYFATVGWSKTDPNGTDEMGTSLMGSWWEEPTSQNGYSVYLGVRYDLDDLGLKVGAEYNWGSEYWLSFTPGHDDMYASKLGTRGNVFELYMIYDLPGGEAVSKFGKAFMRLGYQNYKYDYTGSNMWLGAPVAVGDLGDPLAAQFYAPTDKINNFYLTFEAFF